MMIAPKPLRFIGSTRKALRAFPSQIRRVAGYQLFRVQNGLEPSDWKPMKTVGRGVREIRLHHEGQYRVIYVANLRDAVYVLHAFQKKKQGTRIHDIEKAKQRLRTIQEK
jgi:phage-related protein